MYKYLEENDEKEIKLNKESKDIKERTEQFKNLEKN
jgi:hypothetical protein